jgi:hypothetical protein
LGRGTSGLLTQLLGQVRQVAVSFVQLRPDTGKEQDAGGRGGGGALDSTGS